MDGIAIDFQSMDSTNTHTNLEQRWVSDSRGFYFWVNGPFNNNCWVPIFTFSNLTDPDEKQTSFTYRSHCVTLCFGTLSEHVMD